MQNTRTLVVAMAAKCRTLLQDSTVHDPSLAMAIHPKHLLWMCNSIEKHADEWPESKLHRWIGFVQCGILVNRILDLPGLKRMFNQAKTEFGGPSHDDDLIDHLDVHSSFELELGGEG